MIVPNNPKEIFESLLKATDDNLKPQGFVRRGPTFRLFSEGNCGLIEFQKSTKSSHDDLIFTVNLGIVCGDLAGDVLPDVHKARIIDAHLRQRIGMLLLERSDKWWQITASSNRDGLIQELIELLIKIAVPYVKSHLPTDSLITLWESGQSPGLTAVQRSRFLSLLKKSKIEM